MIRKILRYILPKPIQNSIKSMLIAMATVLVKLFNGFAGFAMRQMATHHENVLWISRSSARSLLKDFYSKPKTEQRVLLRDIFGWEIPENAHWELSDWPNENDIFSVVLKGFIAFETPSDLMLWKLTYQYAD